MNSINYRKEYRKPAPESLLEILKKSPEQNVLIIERVRRGLYDDPDIFSSSVKIRDVTSGSYMFDIESPAAFYRLYNTSAAAPGIFFISGDKLKDRFTEDGFICVSYEQFVMEDPVSDFKDESSDFEYGPAGIRDLDQIVSTYQTPEFGYHYLKTRIERGPSVCAWYKGKLAGYLLTHANGEAGPIYVFPEYRRQHLGYSLVLRMNKMLQEQDILPIVLISPDNIASINLAEKSGYKKVHGRVMWVYRTAKNSMS